MKFLLPAFLFAASTALASPFIPGNVVVVRVGTGTGALSNAATAVFLDEYTPAGILVQSVAVPTAASGANQALTISGTATSEGALTRTADGRFLVLTGYAAAPGLAGVSTTTAAATNRIIGRVAANGTLDTSTRLSDGISGNNIRAAASADGSTFYAVGGAGGVRYLPFGNAGATTALAAAPLSNRYVAVASGNLYTLSSGTGANQIGSGLPTTAGQTNAAVPGLATAASSSPYAVFFADLSAAVPGPDVAYVTDDRTAAGGGIQKYSLVAGTWALNGTIASGATVRPALRGLAGAVAPVGNVVTLAATSTNGLYVLSDGAGYNAAPTNAVLPATPVATASGTSVFRGAAFAPVGGLATRAEATVAQLSTYPNPAHEVLTIARPGLAVTGQTAAVLDATGRVIRTAVLPASGEMSLRGLPAGLYVLRVAGLSRRVVVE